MTIEKFPYILKNTTAYQGKVGLILLSTDFHTLYEFEPILQNTGILYFPARIVSQVQITPDTLLLMRDAIAQECHKILPDQDLEVVAFSCTAASVMIGENVVDRLIRSTATTRSIKATTNPISAFKKVLSFLSIDAISVLTPYSDKVTLPLIDKFIGYGITIDQVGSFKEESDNNLPHISPQSIIDATIQMAKSSKASTIFISCTSLNICRYIEKLEQLTNKIIITSNQIMAWDILQLCDYKTPIKHWGTLLQKER